MPTTTEKLNFVVQAKSHDDLRNVLKAAADAGLEPSFVSEYSQLASFDEVTEERLRDAFKSVDVTIHVDDVHGPELPAP